MRILLADGQPNVRHALHVLLARRPELDLVGDATDGCELKNLLSTTDPDLLILDWMLPGLAEEGSIQAIRMIQPELKIIALSSRPEHGREAISAGADAFVSKIDPPEKLLIAIDRFRNNPDPSPICMMAH